VLSMELLPHGLVGADETLWPTAKMLFPMGTTNGARSLRLPVGGLEVGSWADFVTIDLEHISLIGTTAETLLADMTLTMPAAAVRDVYVGGQVVIEDGRHGEQEAIIADYRRAVLGLFG
jgi:formimidoylglutamate deiminase